eukprot:CAMPEP_0113611088 /NCGR_PEP_ID=MMETSP0017_2-20120614/5369_1 /TAXON_ID=2856 /ORGANISM="Cylindrotheca closterium" /LENGTH=178 /DNA_ID=CAMNT_0000520011 /DNA_START=287 /DNA_END=823 /DNA_ORIENTATION=+ /assembly_acc=CAM_ASM_000147
MHYNIGNNKLRNKRRKVQFAPSPSIVASTESPQPDADQLWYRKSEISEFKADARRLVQATRSPEDFLKDASLRGLESSTLERRLYRHKTIQCTLSAYKKSMNPEDVAKIAHICGTWNVEVAFVEACRDYYAAYPRKQVVVPKVSSEPPAFPFALRRAKSRAPPCHHEQPKRKVRRRLS